MPRSADSCAELGARAVGYTNTACCSNWISRRAEGPRSFANIVWWWRRASESRSADRRAWSVCARSGEVLDSTYRSVGPRSYFKRGEGCCATAMYNILSTQLAAELRGDTVRSSASDNETPPPLQSTLHVTLQTQYHILLAH